LDEFEGGAAAGGDVGDFVGETCLLDGGDGIAATDDAEGAGAGDGIGDGEGTMGEGWALEDAHRAVPEDRLGGGDTFAILRGCFITNVVDRDNISNVVDTDGRA